MTDKTVLDKVMQLPDEFSADLADYVDYLLYRMARHSAAIRPQRSHEGYDFGSYDLGLQSGVSLSDNLAALRGAERY